MAEVTKEGVKCFAHPITLGQYFKIRRKFPAFIEASVTLDLLDSMQDKEFCIKLKEDNRYLNFSLLTKKGLVQEYDKDGKLMPILVVDREMPYSGNSREGIHSYPSYTGLRVGIHPMYDAKSKVVASKKNITRIDGIEDEAITSTGTVVTFGGIDYLWLNEEQCENGEEKLMDLASVGIVARDRKRWGHCLDGYDWDDIERESFRELSEQVVLAGCDEDEMALLQEGMLLKEEGYETWHPISAKKQKKIEKKETAEQIHPIHVVYEQIEAGKISAEQARKYLSDLARLKGLLFDPDFSKYVGVEGHNKEKYEAKMTEFSEKLKAEHEAYEQRQARIKEENQKWYGNLEQLGSSIDDLRF